MSAAVVKLPTAARRMVQQPHNKGSRAAGAALREQQGITFDFRSPTEREAEKTAKARRDFRQAARDRHFDLRVRLLAAYHDSCARAYRALNERMKFGIDDADAIRLAGEHELAAVEMVRLFDEFVRLPVSGKVERAERRKMMRKVAQGIGGAGCALTTYRERKPAWDALLAEQAA